MLLSTTCSLVGEFRTVIPSISLLSGHRRILISRLRIMLAILAVVSLVRGIILLLFFLRSLLPTFFVGLSNKLSVVNVLIHDVIAETPGNIMMFTFDLILIICFLAGFIVAVFHVIIVVVPFVDASVLSVLRRVVFSRLFLTIPVVIGISVHM